MLTSVIVSVSVVMAFVVVAGGSAGAGPRPAWATQPATAAAPTGRAVRRRPLDWAAATTLDDDDPSIVMDSLRAVGLVRRGVERPVVGRKAYVRTWERIRAVIVLSAIIVSLGALLAATIGLIVLAAGFLLEQAIS